MKWIKDSFGNYVNIALFSEISINRPPDHAMEQGWWIVGSEAAETNILLRGPFDSDEDAKVELEALMREIQR